MLPGNIELFRIEMASGEGRENLLSRYTETIVEEYDYILIDTPPTPSVWMTSSLIASNFYIIPVKPDPISFTGIDLLKSVIDSREETYGLKIKCLGVVLTIVEEDTLNYKAARERLSKDKKWSKYLFKGSMLKRVALARAQGQQQHVLDLDDSAARLSMTSIVRELEERLSNDK